jgi:hypothetical protein
MALSNKPKFPPLTLHTTWRSGSEELVYYAASKMAMLCAKHEYPNNEVKMVERLQELIRPYPQKVV